MERKLPGKYLENFGYTSLVLFLEILEDAKDSDRKFRSNGKRPLCLPVSPLLPLDFRVN